MTDDNIDLDENPELLGGSQRPVPYMPVPFSFGLAPVNVNGQPMICLELTWPNGETTAFFTIENAARLAQHMLKMTRQAQVEMSHTAKLVGPDGEALIR